MTKEKMTLLLGGGIILCALGGCTNTLEKQGYEPLIRVPRDIFDTSARRRVEMENLARHQAHAQREHHS